MITAAEPCRGDRRARTDVSRFPKHGVTYLSNRHYDPTTGVFISVDPLVTKTMQPYIYGAANPIRFSDPQGLEPRSIHCLTGCGDPRKPVADPHGQQSDGYGNDRIGRPQRTRGRVPVEQLSGLLPDRYAGMVGQGDGVPNDKVIYRGRPIEFGERQLFGGWSFYQRLAYPDRLKGVKNLVEESRVNTDSLDSSPGNARRHVMLSAIMTWRYGEDFARDVLDAHENIVGGMLQPGHELDANRMVDLINNETGIALGNQFAQLEQSERWILDCSWCDSGVARLEEAVLMSPDIVYIVTAD